MKAILLFLSALLVSAGIRAQDSVQVAHSKIAVTVPTALDLQIERFINQAPVFGKSSLIYIHDGVAATDTIALAKFKLQKKDSTVLVKLKGHGHMELKAGAFWGTVTDFGERRRFYKGHSFPLWRTKAPYIYKLENGSVDWYFFSETLTGPMYQLSVDHISCEVNDPNLKLQLLDYMQVNHIANPNVYDDHQLGDFLATTGDTIFGTVCWVLENWLLCHR